MIAGFSVVVTQQKRSDTVAPLLLLQQFISFSTKRGGGHLHAAAEPQLDPNA